MRPIQLVWFKRDLRVRDHRPLQEAARRGKLVGLYVFEPEVLHSAEFDPQHLAWIQEALLDLQAQLRVHGVPLLIRAGSMPAVLGELRRELRFEELWSHEETGLLATYERDLRVARWARENAVRWTEIPQTGVVRRLKSRDGWSRRWLERMSAEEAQLVGGELGPRGVRSDSVPRGAVLGIEPRKRWMQGRGGEREAWQVLDSFLRDRSERYLASMSAPGPGWSGCSRISEHLAFGTISMRCVHQATDAHLRGLREERKRTQDRVFGSWARSLAAFAQRLRWHCHFMQKLEDQPDLEIFNLHRGYDGLREAEFRQDRFEAWKAGRTGYPMVDACVRSLVATGWLNFRMRAMLTSFNSYHLWLHWREPAQWMGRQFLDFEPGIHYSQFQMQSGVTGINTLRMYSPAKQATDHDPKGEFIRRWVPELARVPLEYLAEPHKMPPLTQREVGCVIGEHYPAPIVEHAEALVHARSRFSALRRTEGVRTEAQRIVTKHGSRRKPPPRRRKKQAPPREQQGLFEEQSTD
jgi:deoxyribodipyrimidine photo-lyase